MKFINYLTSIAGIDVFPMISLILFFAFFLGLLVYLARADKAMIETMELLPLDQEPLNRKL